MHSFLWSGKDSNGNKRAERVEAQNAQEAKAILTAEGWTELELIKNEIGDVVTKSRLASSQFEQPELTPDQEAAYYQGKRPGLAAEWRKSLWQCKSPIVLTLLILVLAIVRHRTISSMISGVGLIAIVFIYPVIRIYFGQTSRNFARLNRAKVDGDWKEVLECVERLRRSHRFTRIGLSEIELARNRALALAHLGQLNQALAEYTGNPQLSTIPSWLACSQLAGIYEAGSQYEKVLELRRQMTQEKPDMAAGWVDMALLLARRFNRPAEAREALDHVEKMELTPLEKGYVFYVKGVILWREGRRSEAKAQLELAEQGLQPLAAKPLVGGLILRVKSYLCIVIGELGNRTEARSLFDEVQKYLEAHKEYDLLEACRNGL
jgi:tetratricopeptide (TPR) repeat protein